MPRAADELGLEVVNLRSVLRPRIVGVVRLQETRRERLAPITIVIIIVDHNAAAAVRHFELLHGRLGDDR